MASLSCVFQTHYPNWESNQMTKTTAAATRRRTRHATETRRRRKMRRRGGWAAAIPSPTARGSMPYLAPPHVDDQAPPRSSTRAARPSTTRCQTPAAVAGRPRCHGLGVGMGVWGADSVGVGGVTASSAPQRPQNWASAGLTRPQLGQVTVFSLGPPTGDYVLGGGVSMENTKVIRHNPIVLSMRILTGGPRNRVPARAVEIKLRVQPVVDWLGLELMNRLAAPDYTTPTLAGSVCLALRRWRGRWRRTSCA